MYPYRGRILIREFRYFKRALDFLLGYLNSPTPNVGGYGTLVWVQVSKKGVYWGTSTPVPEHVHTRVCTRTHFGPKIAIFALFLVSAGFLNRIFELTDPK